MRLGATPVVRLERPLAHVKTPGSSCRSAGRPASDRHQPPLTPTSIGRPRRFAWAREERSPSSPPTVRVTPARGQTHPQARDTPSPARSPCSAEHPRTRSPARPSVHRHWQLGGRAERPNLQHSGAPEVGGHRRSRPTAVLNKLWSSPARPWRDSDTPGPRGASRPVRPEGRNDHREASDAARTGLWGLGDDAG
jgi:hypothetical protein